MKRFLIGIGLFAVVYWCSVWAQDAPMFRGDLQHRGVYSAVGVPKLHGIKWKFHTNGRVISSPAVVDDVVYVGSTDGNLYAIDAVSGAQKWKFETKAWEVSSPAVAAGVVYFLSYDGHLYLLDAATAQVKCKFATGGEKHYAATHLHYLQPAPEIMPDPYALDAASGAEKWHFKTGNDPVAHNHMGFSHRPRSWMAWSISDRGIHSPTPSMLRMESNSGSFRPMGRG